LATLAAQRLRQMVPESPERCPVISIYVVADVEASDTSVIEDFLVEVYNQLRQAGTKANGDAARLFEQYIESYNKGQASTHRIQLLQSIVYIELSSLAHAFLVFDGYDRLPKSLQIILDQILHQHQPRLRVLLSRRSPRIVRRLTFVCDICEDGWDLDLYWVCQRCSTPMESFVLCYECKSQKAICTTCNDDLSFTEPYDHVNWKLQVRDEDMMTFIQTNVLRIRKRNVPDVELFHRIVMPAKGNITIAKLRSDDLFTKSRSITSSRDQIADRLPRNLVAFFNAGIEKIELMPEDRRNVTVAAIIFAAEAANHIGITELGIELQSAMRDRLRVPDETFKGFEDLMTSACGFLEMSLCSTENGISCFHPDFKLYVKEDYHRGISDLRARLRGPGIPDSLQEAIISDPHSIVESPPPMSPGFDTIGGSMQTISPHLSREHSNPFGLGLSKASEWTDSMDRMKLSPPRMNSEHQLPLFQTTDILNATPATTRICQFCLTHVLSGKPSGSHHTSVADVAISIGEGCILCGDLYAKLHTFVDFQTPFYTWNIQTSGSKNLDILFEHFEEPPRSRMFHLLHDGNIGNTVTVDELSASTDPWISGGKQIWEWITTCQNDHHECRKASASDWVPTRLLQLSSNNRDMVKLVITKETKITGPYCTLSHSWGITPFLTTTNGNLHDSLTEGIDISTMPKNFRHAIDVARFMKLEYIWIDSLCIIQDGKDFDLEGGTMHLVYQNSYCNIVSADSRDSSGGLFRQRRPIDVAPATYRGKRIFGHHSWSIVPDDLWDAHLLGTFIYTRGWVFQERMLSPRLLHFANKQIFWDCGTLSACEGYPKGLPDAVDTDAATDRHWRGRLQQRGRDKKSIIVGANDDSIETFWQTAVSKYTSCNLTKQKDKTIAIWSIAKTVRDITGEDYACGLWGQRLSEQLAWTVNDITKCSRPAELQWRFPSWSWVSMKGPISAANRLVVERNYVVSDHAENSIVLPLPDLPKDVSKGPDPNIEPTYAMPATIPIRGALNRGILRPSAMGYQLIPQLETMKPVYEADSFFDAYPDEPLDATDTSTSSCLFVLLAATEYSPDVAFSSPQLPTEAQANKLYSGIGILLEEPSLAIPRYEKQMPKLKQDLECCTEAWKKQNLEDDIVFLENFLKALAQEVEECASGKQYYRRMGAVHFQGVGEDAWRDLVSGRESYFWLI
jgi:hypothetical protein